MEAIINELFLELKKASKRVMSDGEWTETIKSIFQEIGTKNDYVVRPFLGKTAKEDRGEWLYDIIWYRGDPNEYIKSLDLICESELKTSSDVEEQIEHILYDFNKLLVSNAKTKIMITHTYKAGHIDEIIDACKNAVKTYCKTENVVLLINYDFEKELEMHWI